jgi:hypothetical protein
MKNLKNISFATIAGATILVSSSGCGKYEDGPGFTLLTKKSRVVGDWEVKSIGSTVLSSEYGINMNFEKSGSMSFNYTYSGIVQEVYAGTWDFASDKENLMITLDGEATVFEIKRLTNNEMWLDDDISAADGDIWKLESK